MIVMKFGGSSLESAAAIERVCGIVASRVEQRPVVVVSAMGKTTNRLLAIGEVAVAGKRDDAIRLLEGLRAYHTSESQPLVPDGASGEWQEFIESHYRELSELVKGLVVLGEFTPRSVDAISAFGERISSHVVTLALRKRGIDSTHVDSRRVIVTNDRFSRAAPLFEPTNQRLVETLKPLVDAGKTVVMGGFIASTVDGVTSTLGRGGSDYSAAIVGAGIGADDIQIWTDVDGVLTADPSIIKEAKRLRILSFAEASELAYFGARVLHPSTLIPAVEHNIPVHVLNSRRPEIEGTQIVAECPPSHSTVKSIAYKENITVVYVESTRMLMAHGFLAKIFEVFDRYQTPVDMVSTSEVSVSLTIDRTDRLAEITSELEKFAKVSHNSKRAIVCVVGDRIRYTPGIAVRIFGALKAVNIEMISQGASRLNVSFVIDEKDLNQAVQNLHHEFFTDIDEQVFA